MTEQQDIERLADLEAEEARMKPEVLDPADKTANWFYVVVLIVLGFLAGILFSTAAYAEHDHQYPENCDNHEFMSEKMREAGYMPFFVGVDGEDDNYVLVIWTNDSEGIWMLHEVYRDKEMQCHLMGGVDFADRSALGEPV